MTKDAQNALRRIIEDFTEITRFVLICNYITKIIEPLNSRCMKFRFKQIPRDVQVQRLESICARESIKYNPQAIQSVVEISNGDLRKALNLLQMANSTKPANMDITHDDVVFVSDVLPVEDVFGDIINKYLQISKSKGSNKEKTKIEFIDELVNMGYTAQQLVTAIHKQLHSGLDIRPLQKARVMVALTEAEESVLVGVSDFTVFSLLLAQIESIIG